MGLSELIKRVNKRMTGFDGSGINDFTKRFGPDEMTFLTSSYSAGSTDYLRWICCLAREVQPKKVVELGAFTGSSTAMFLAGMPKDSKLISVDIDPQSWGVVPEDSRLLKVVGDDVSEKSIFPEGTDLSDADIWFIDSDHTGRHLKKEIKKYSPLWKKGTIVIVDDVDYPQFNDYNEVWRSLPYKKKNLSNLHYTGFGIFIV